MYGASFGEQGDILDTQIMKSDFYFTQGFYGIPLEDSIKSYIILSYINSVLTQYTVNLYTGVHKKEGYVNLLPMPQDYYSRKSDIERITNKIIVIKRHWFSLDETNLEYHGLIAQIGIAHNIEKELLKMQEQLNEQG